MSVNFVSPTGLMVGGEHLITGVAMTTETFFRLAGVPKMAILYNHQVRRVGGCCD